MRGRLQAASLDLRSWRAEDVDLQTERRQRLYRLSAVVLKRRELGEADRLLTVFSPDRGKLTLLAKGVRKPASRKAGHIEPFTYTSFLVARGRSMDLVTQAETIAPHRRLREDLWRSAWAYYACELADAFTQDGDPNAPLFDLLLETLGRLDGGADPAPAVRFYELHVLGLVGYQPQLFRCVRCDSVLQPEVNYLSLELGGCLCPKHGTAHPESVALQLTTLKVLRYLQTRDWAQVAGIHLSPGTARQVEAVLGSTIVYHLERSLRSPAYIERLRLALAGAAEAGGAPFTGQEAEPDADP